MGTYKNHEHPYDVEILEELLRNVVDECLEDGLDNAREKLSAMCFTKEQMEFFGFPEVVN